MQERILGGGLEMVLINAPAGDWAGGERGIAALPGREEEFQASIGDAVAYARELMCPRVHVMSGLVGPPFFHRRRADGRARSRSR